MAAVERATAEHQSEFSPHSPESLRFVQTVVGMTGHWLDVLRDGLRFEFSQLPGQYFEQNNKSAMHNMDFVRETVSSWLQAGHIEQLDTPAWCTSPLSVAQKYDAVNNVLKERLVLDLSRHVNTFIPDKHIKLDDLSVSEHLLDVNDYMASFDLKNQFFHVKLHPSMYKFCGFSCADEAGKVCFYQFKVLIYGCKPAVHIVTRLLMPIKSFLHTLGIKISIFIDDGRVAAASAAETTAKMNLSLLVLQLAGWNIQWKKCVLIPSQQLAHLGFVTDTVAMRYTVAEEKISVLKLCISDILKYYFGNVPVPAKLVATVLGKIVSMKRSHGDILSVMSRSCQHELGVHVLKHGWNTSLRITPKIVTELSFVLDTLDSGNGQPIFTAAAMAHTVELIEAEKYIAAVQNSDQNIENLFVSDASESHAFVYSADGNFSYVQEFEFSAAQRELSSGHRELLAIKFTLESDHVKFLKFTHGKVYWQTDSQNVFRFLRRGSRQSVIQSDIVAIKRIEKELCIKIVPVWTPRDHGRLVLADIGSKFSRSTDEWSADRHNIQIVLDYFGFMPTVDAFASSHNTVCQKYFSLIPQTGSAGVNFFAQNLSQAEKYFCCPPVSLIVPCFQTLVASPGIHALLLIPDWSGQPFWPFLFNGTQRQPQIRDVFRFRTGFTFSNAARSHIFTRNPNFDMLALIVMS